MIEFAMQVFEVLKTLETRRVNASIVGDLLTADRMLIITDDDSRAIFLFRGQKSSLVLYFIAKRLAHDIRVFMRGFYTIKELLDQDSVNSIASAPVNNTGKIPEIVRADSIYPANPPDSPPNGQEISPINPNWLAELKIEKLPVFDLPKASEILSIVKNTLSPALYQTEFLLIGNAMYTPVTGLSEFVKTRRIEHKFDKLGPLPEGKFYEPNLSSRLFIKNGRIECVQFLRSVNESKNYSKLNVPLLYIHRIMNDRPMDLIQNAFKIPPDEPIETILERAKTFKASIPNSPNSS